MPQRRSGPAQDRENGSARGGVPSQRAGGHDRSRVAANPDPGDVVAADPGPGAGGGADVRTPMLTPDSVGPEARPESTEPPQRRSRLTAGTLPRLRLPLALARLRERKAVRDLGSDALALIVAALDVYAGMSGDAAWYSHWLSWLTLPAMLLRRHVPLVALLITIPGFLAGWAQLSAMIALGTLARRHLISWQTAVGAALVGISRFMLWPWSAFLDLTWREHLRDVVYGVLVAGMPVAIGLLFAVRQELSTRLKELARSREREKRLHAATVRSAERAKLAREMHDVVSHQVTLIAMQAGAMQVDVRDPATREAAETIRSLSTKTLEELRELVGVLRSGVDDDEAQPGLEDIADLTQGADIRLSMDACPADTPGPVSRAAYRTVQEALTNVRKHAAGSWTSVRVVADADALVVEIRNDPPRRRHVGTLPSGGHGLLGLRERAGLLGGSFHAGPTDNGGFEVRARYPLAD
ncbi:histidine kinase [Actinokineospora cianjurensis]|uniref:histidine kinase n=1 Tax=Actinokineospora cianjurensis TaxID=585224 RepID=A0A421B4K2_9PSEU|nr:histidine kinase [Actinokineospora cianjurensis]RLK59279.1 signal transduction histidine kinase [Actinokineospora cianjurensis]